MERYRGLLEQYVERYNAGDLDGVMALYAEDSVQLMPDGTFTRVEVPGMELVRVRDGKVVVDNLYYDTFAVAAQLGFLPQQVPTKV